jgi:hypothetical protein
VLWITSCSYGTVEKRRSPHFANTSYWCEYGM